MQVLSGDAYGAVIDHEVFYAVWKKYKAIPERFNFNSKTPEIPTYPLRPEFIESTYLLYRATGQRLVLYVGCGGGSVVTP